MTQNNVKEEILKFLESKIVEEQDTRFRLNKIIYYYSLEGIDTDIDAMPAIMDSIREYNVSEHVTHEYYKIIEYVKNLDF